MVGAAAIAHELNLPLAAILANVGGPVLPRTTRPPVQVREIVDAIAQDNRAAAAIQKAAPSCAGTIFRAPCS
jgi:signal transduction histidine kinase